MIRRLSRAAFCAPTVIASASMGRCGIGPAELSNGRFLPAAFTTIEEIVRCIEKRRS